MRPATVDVGPTLTYNTAIVGWGLPSFLSSYRKNYGCGDPVVCRGEEVCRCLKVGHLLEARPDRRRAAINVTRQGGAGTAVPDLSIEVDNFDEVLRRCEERGLAAEYGPVTEPWGVRRFYVRDPFGRLVNVLAHVDA